MHIQASFKAAIGVLTELAHASNPAYVRVRAACKLADILSPANRAYGDILHVLNSDEPAASRLRAAQRPEPPTENPCAVFCTDEDDEEDEESEGANQDDEPP